MEIVDAQIHMWDHDTPAQPWDAKFGAAGGVAAKAAAHYREDQPITAAVTLKAMREAGVDAAIAVSPSLYGFDGSYALKMAANHPGKFGVVRQMNPAGDDVDERVAHWRSQPFALGLRIVFLTDASRAQLEDGFYNPLLAAAQRHGMPLCLFLPGHMSYVATVAKSYPALQIVIDHLGLRQPPLMTVDAEPFAQLPDLLALATFPNVAVKLTAAPSLSRAAYPFADIWPPLHRIIRSFGTERLMWGTDWTRVAKSMSYADGVRYMTETDELSSAEKEQLMGRSLRSIFRWQA